MSDRFFSSTPITADRTTLDGPEAHHLSHVMRAAPGERLTLFDGSGAEFEAEVVTVRRSAVELRVIERHQIDRELPFPLEVGVALPKGDRQKWLVEKLTELGVTSLVPLVTERGVAQPTAGAIERLHRTVIEASKQCGRNRLMRITEPQAWLEWIAAEPPAQSCRRLVAHSGGQPVTAVDLQTPQATQLAIGPEGGLTQSEMSAATATGWQLVDLGPRILRVETAAVVFAAAVTMHDPSDFREGF
jgi:16S rRNA (uracil1498-N3)-methyltransferase